MARDRAAPTAAPRERPPARVAAARGRQCDLLCAARGIAWRLLPSDFPPWQTVYRWFAAWRDQGVFEKINHALVMADRERVGRDASPSAAIIDSQSVKTTEAARAKRKSKSSQYPD